VYETREGFVYTARGERHRHLLHEHLRACDVSNPWLWIFGVTAQPHPYLPVRARICLHHTTASSKQQTRSSLISSIYHLQPLQQSHALCLDDLASQAISTRSHVRYVEHHYPLSFPYPHRNILLRRRDNTLILSTRDVIQRALEMSLGILKRGSVFVRLQIGVDELDESVEILCSDLDSVSVARQVHGMERLTASFSWSK
jgi:hypothetical protein